MPDNRKTHKKMLKILFVEDDPESSDLFVNCFDTEYHILLASSAEQALEIFKKESDIAMVLSDQAMPGMTGVDLLSKIYTLDQDTVRIIITGYIDISDTIDAVNRGHIYQFVLKPWDIVQMRMILMQAGQAWTLVKENKQLHQQVIEQNTMLTMANQQLQISKNNLQSLSSNLITAREDEQKRIALELHDELGQSLAALKLNIKVLQNGLNGQAPHETAKTNSRLERLKSDIDLIIENVRRLSKNLSPVIIDDLGLDAAIENIVLTFTKAYAITCSFRPSPLTAVQSGEAQRLVYRLIQEILNNIGKHSRATKMDFTITHKDDVYLFEIIDNGRGFNVQQTMRSPATSKGIGLMAMQERVTMLGGTFSIKSVVGQGTTITFTVPFDPDVFREKA